MDFFLSFIMISVAGTLLSVLFPSGGAKKPLKLLVSFVLCLTVFSLASEKTGSFSFPFDDFSFSVDKEIREDAPRFTAMGIEHALSEKTAVLIEAYTGLPPEAVKCTVSYSGETFILEKVKIYMPDRDKVTVFARLASELGIDYNCIELCEVS